MFKNSINDSGIFLENGNTLTSTNSLFVCENNTLQMFKTALGTEATISLSTGGNILYSAISDPMMDQFRSANNKFISTGEAGDILNTSTVTSETLQSFSLVAGSPAIEFSGPNATKIDILGHPISGSKRDCGSHEFDVRLLFEFITEWNVLIGESITIPTVAGEIYNYTINWGDGTPIENVTTSNPRNHTYLTTDTVRIVKIAGVFPVIMMSASNQMNRDKLVKINQFGNIRWKTFNNAFANCRNLESVRGLAPDLSGVTNMDSMFEGCSKLDADFSNWKITLISSMNKVFDGTNLSIINYDNLLTAWAAQTVMTGVNFGVDGLGYCQSVQSRSTLGSKWIIRGDYLSCGDAPLSVMPNGMIEKEGNEGSFDSRFGQFIAISGDGQTMVTIEKIFLSSYLVYKFKTDTDTWEKISTIFNNVNSRGSIVSLSMNFDGSILAIGTPFDDNFGNLELGSVVIYKFSQEENEYIQFGNKLIGEITNYQLGWSVSLNNDGNILAMGSLGDQSRKNGKVMTFKVDTSDLDDIIWNQLGNVIIGTNNNDQLGFTLELNDTGNNIICGGSSDGNPVVEVFKLNNNNAWVPASTIPIPLPLNFTDIYNVSINDSGEIIAVFGKDVNEREYISIFRLINLFGLRWFPTQQINSTRGNSPFSVYGYGFGGINSMGTRISVVAQSEYRSVIQIHSSEEPTNPTSLLNFSNDEAEISIKPINFVAYSRDGTAIAVSSVNESQKKIILFFKIRGATPL